MCKHEKSRAMLLLLWWGGVVVAGIGVVIVGYVITHVVCSWVTER